MELAFRRVSSGLPFQLLSVESFGRLEAPALLLLCSLADHAVQAGGPGLSRAALVSGALRELGVTPCHGNASLRRSGLYNLTRCLVGPRCAASLVPRPRWSEFVRGCLLAVALADVCVWSQSRVGLSCVPCVCLCLASPLRLLAPML
jgi:urea transporter